MRTSNTYMGRHDKDLFPTPVETIPVDDDHQIKVYQFIGRETLLYVPQLRHTFSTGHPHWFNYIEQVGCSEGEWDSWATFVKENAIKKCQKGAGNETRTS